VGSSRIERTNASSTLARGAHASKMAMKSYGPNGKLSPKDVKTDPFSDELCCTLARDQLEKSLSVINPSLVGINSDHARFYFWAFYGLQKKYFLLREYKNEP